MLKARVKEKVTFPQVYQPQVWPVKGRLKYSASKETMKIIFY